jgi:cholesterol transport system auxiliary component
MKLLIGVTSLLLSLLLAGCIGGKARVPLQVIAAPTPVALSTPAPTIDRQLTVATPSAAAMFDGRRVVARHGDGELAYLSGVSLPDSAPAMLQDTLISQLQVAGFRAVERQGNGLRGDLVVNLQLQRFEVDYSDSRQPRGHVQLQVLLIDSRSGRALGSKGLSAEHVASASGAEQGVRALLAASAEVMVQAADWLVEAATSAPAESEAAPAPN